MLFEFLKEAKEDLKDWENKVKSYSKEQNG